MKLVEDAKNAWRWYSIQAMTLAGAIQGAWMAMPPDLKDKLPPELLPFVSLVLMGMGIVGRLVTQDPKPIDDEPKS